MAYIKIDTELCKGCRLCINICPKKCLEQSGEFNSRAYHYAVQTRPEDCIGCKLCAFTCADCAIEVFKEE